MKANYTHRANGRSPKGYKRFRLSDDYKLKEFTEMPFIKSASGFDHTPSELPDNLNSEYERAIEKAKK